MTTAYNPDDPLQANFLSALALGETGNNGSMYTTYNGTSSGGSWQGDDTTATGFPIFSGTDNSHAAGLFQFEPATWAGIASQYGLNFGSASDQAEGAWYLAQQKDPNLESDLSSGNYSSIQSSLASIWPSVTGNGAAPKGLANDLASGTGASSVSSLLGNSSTSTSGGGDVSSSSGSGTSSSGGIISDIENWFLRGGLIIIGGLVALVALWMLLGDNGVVPGPSKVAGALAL